MAVTRRLLLRVDPHDAVFCANDTMGLAAITFARHEFGLDAGLAISIAGFDEVPMAIFRADVPFPSHAVHAVKRGA